MATHPSNKDPIAKIVLLISAVLLLAAVYVLVTSLFNTISRNTAKGEIDTETSVANNIAMAQKVIHPIGEVTTSDGSGVVAAGPVRSGEEVYTAVCQACHSTGAAEAPRIDDKAAWESRIANGFDGLVKTAIDGKGAMPARGGQNVSDAELKASIAYMINKVGINLDIPKDEPASAAAPGKTEEKNTESSAPEASKATSPAVAEASSTAAKSEANKVGEKIYKASCFACHGTGVAGAPKTGDKAAWKARIAKGNDTLHTSAIKGMQGETGVMPAKGGNLSLSDDEVKAAVDYMVSQSGINLDIPKDEPASAAAPEKTEEKSSTESSSPKAVEAATPVAPPNHPTAPEKADAPEAPKTPDSPAPEAAPAVAMATTATALETAAAPVTAEAETPAVKSGANELGEKIYKTSCFACHGMGVAGAPKTGEKAAWKARIAKGNDTLYTSAIKGIQGETGVMPPKGGNFSISDDEVKAAVDYMVSQSQ